MPGQRLLPCTCLIAAMPTAPAASQPDTGKKLPFLGPPPPEELQVLAPLVGQWTTKWDVRPSLQEPEGYTAEGQATGQWLHNRHFIRVEGTATSPKHRMETTTLYTYDRSKRIYRRWLFASTSLTTESEGRWDQAKRTMTWKSVGLVPEVTGGVTDVVGKERIETTVFFKRNDGKATADIRIVATRKN